MLQLLVVLFSFSSFAAYEAYFSPADDLDQVVYQTILEAEESVDIAIYTFRSKKVREALLEKAKQGVQIRILVRTGDRDQTIRFLKPLWEQGVKVRYLTVTNHHKYAIVDREVLLNSSANFNDSWLQKTYDENLFVCDSCGETLDLFQNEFEFLYQNSNVLIGTNDVSAENVFSRNWVRESLAFFTSYNFTPFFNKRTKKISFRKKKKDGIVVQQLVEEMDRASSSIKVATGHLRSYALYEAMVRAHKRGVDVQLVSDSQEYISDYRQRQEDEKIEDCLRGGQDMTTCTRSGVHFARKAFLQGISVRIKYYSFFWSFPTAPQMHHKYMIVDGKTVFTGSYNWSNNAEYQTFENIARLEEPSVVRQYMKNFKKVMSYGKGQFSQLRRRMENAETNFPMSFAPVSISFQSIDRLRSIACEKCPQKFCPWTVQPDDNPPNACKD